MVAVMALDAEDYEDYITPFGMAAIAAVLQEVEEDLCSTK
jgi:hypothetical protein